MTDQEILDGFKAMTERTTGAVTALKLVIRSLQAQPGYDHRRFLRRLATLQVVGETEPGAPAFQEEFQATLECFGKPVGR
jgi:hypothetical protein